MRIDNHRLVGADGRAVPFVPAAHAGGAITPRFLVIHYTAGGPAAATIGYFASPAARASAHFVIDRDGTITQQVDCNRAAWHAGRSAWKGVAGLNACSIGIELANWGPLWPTPSGHVSHAGVRVEAERVIHAAHRDEPGTIRAWELFPPAQIEAAAAAAAALCQAYGMEEDAIVGHDAIAPRRKIDPGPAFDMRAFRGRVGGRAAMEGEPAARLVVTARHGLNLRTGPGLDAAIVALAPQGTSLDALSRHGEWWLVASAATGTTGYAHGRFLAEA